MKILLISYGGGHIRMLLPICEVLLEKKGIEVVLLPLTLAYPAAIARLPRTVIRSLSSFLPLFDTDVEEILTYGMQLLSENHNPTLSIPRIESIAFLGLSYFDLTSRIGAEAASKEYRANKRHAFIPTTVATRILEAERPDVVVVTSSPGWEQAFITQANRLGIATVQLLDLFEDVYPLPVARDVVVMNNDVARKLKTRLESSQNVHALGQPALEDTVRRVEKIDREKRRRDLGVEPKEQVLLIASHIPAISDADLRVKGALPHDQGWGPAFEVVSRVAADSGCRALLRVHPSERAELYHKLLLRYSNIVLINEIFDVYESLAVSDIVFSGCSTLLVEGALCGKASLSYQRADEEFYLMPRAKEPPFIFSRGPAELEVNLRRCLGSAQHCPQTELLVRGAREAIVQLLCGS